jgi:hypothetical protein
VSETDWIESSVLRAVDRPIKVWTQPVKLNDSLYVSRTSQDHHKTFFKDMRREGYVNFGVYEMGDEKWCANPVHYSYYNDWDFGIRNYFNHHLPARYPHVQYVPLGMRSGFGPITATQLLPSNLRQTTCNFIGSLRSNRRDMLHVQGRWLGISGQHSFHIVPPHPRKLCVYAGALGEQRRELEVVRGIGGWLDSNRATG